MLRGYFEFDNALNWKLAKRFHFVSRIDWAPRGAALCLILCSFSREAEGSW